MKRHIETLCWTEMVWNRPFALERVHELLVHLASLTPRGPVLWEVRGCNGCVRHLLGADRHHLEKIKELFRTHGDIRFFDTPEHIRKVVGTVKRLKISHPSLSLQSDLSLAVIRAGLAALASAEGKEEIVLQMVLGSSYAPSAIPKHLSNPTASWLQVLSGTVPPASPDNRTAMKEKVGHHGFRAIIRLGCSGTHANARIYDLFSALRTLESIHVRMSLTAEKAGDLNRGKVPWHLPLRLSVKELASFLLLPAGEAELAGTAGLHPKPLSPPAWYRNPTGPVHDRTFAVSTDTGEQVRLSISPQDALEHTVLLGPTGCGKSTVLLHLALADINAGRSVLVIDPKADLVHDILARVPESRKKDVVVMDPSDPCPVGFNPLAFQHYPNRPLIADAILAVCKEIFRENWGIRSQDLFSAALLTLSEIERASLLWLPLLLTDEVFRRNIVTRVQDRVALSPFWEHFENLRDTQRQQEIAPVLNKMRQFLLRPGLRSVLGQSNPKFDLTDLFHQRRIVLVPLNKGIIGAESARLLGSLIVGLIWTLALSRAVVPPERRHLVTVYIDELQDYLALPTDLSDALAQARGLGLGICMAHQYRDQLPLSIRAGVDANARNKIVFGLQGNDARDLSGMAPQLTPADFMSLPRYRIYTSFQNNGKSTGWIQGQTLPPPPALRIPAELKAQSMERYGEPVEEIERELLNLMQQKDRNNKDWDGSAIGRRKLS